MKVVSVFRVFYGHASRAVVGSGQPFSTEELQFLTPGLVAPVKGSLHGKQSARACASKDAGLTT